MSKTHKGGRRAIRPIVVLTKKGKATSATLRSPTSSDERAVVSTGPYAALGLLMDQGYRFSSLHTTAPPAWASGQHKSVVVGWADVTSFPL